MNEVQTLREIWDYGNNDIRNMILKIKINKHENIGGLYWDDVGLPGKKKKNVKVIENESIISSKKCENYSRSTLGVAVWHDIYADDETSGLMGLLCINPSACAKAIAKERGPYAALHKYYYQSNFSANMQNRDVQTCEGEGSVVFENKVERKIYGLQRQ
jgi:hypothetical protein